MARCQPLGRVTRDVDMCAGICPPAAAGPKSPVPFPSCAPAVGTKMAGVSKPAAIRNVADAYSPMIGTDAAG